MQNLEQYEDKENIYSLITTSALLDLNRLSDNSTGTLLDYLCEKNNQANELRLSKIWEHLGLPYWTKRNIKQAIFREGFFHKMSAGVCESKGEHML